MLQDLFSEESPTQSNPLLAGAGSAHVLSLVSVAFVVLWANEHAPHWFHSVQFPLTKVNSHYVHLLNVINLCNLYRLSFCLYIVCLCSHLNSCTYYVIIGVCSIQHYVTKFVSDLRQVGGFPHQ